MRVGWRRRKKPETKPRDQVKKLVEHRVTVPGEHEIIGIRELDSAEASQIEAADVLVSRVARAYWLRRFKMLEGNSRDRIRQVEAHDQPTRREVDECRASVVAAINAADRVGDEFSELLVFCADAEARAEVTMAVSALTESDEWSLLKALSTPERSLVVDRQSTLGVITSEGGFAPLGALLDQVAEDVQAVYTETLVALSDEVLEASTLLRTIHAECPQGMPSLIDASALASVAEDQNTVSITPRALAISEIVEALRLVRTAERVIEGTMPGGDGVPGELDDYSDTSDKAPEFGVVSSSDDGPMAPYTASDDDVESTDAGDGLGAIATIDVVGLLNEASRLNDILAKAWSGALNRAMAQEGIEHQMAALRAAVQGFHGMAQDEGVELEEFPPSSEMIEAFERDPRRARERWVSAQLVAFTEVMETLDDLSRPTAMEVQIRDGKVSRAARFWESGAFARLRAGLNLLKNLVDEAPSSATNLLEVGRRLTLAKRAWAGGDPEACAFHAACALAAHQGAPVDDLDGVGVGHPDRGAALAALRAIDAQMAGEPSLDIATLTATSLAHLVADVSLPHVDDREQLSPDELFDMLVDDVPFVPVDGELDVD